MQATLHLGARKALSACKAARAAAAILA